jgi:hypothetical protein
MRHNAEEVYVRRLCLAYRVMDIVDKDEPLPNPTPEGSQSFLTVHWSFSPEEGSTTASGSGVSERGYLTATAAAASKGGGNMACKYWNPVPSSFFTLLAPFPPRLGASTTGAQTALRCLSGPFLYYCWWQLLPPCLQGPQPHGVHDPLELHLGPVLLGVRGGGGGASSSLLQLPARCIRYGVIADFPTLEAAEMERPLVVAGMPSNPDLNTPPPPPSMCAKSP